MKQRKLFAVAGALGLAALIILGCRRGGLAPSTPHLAAVAKPVPVAATEAPDTQALHSAPRGPAEVETAAPADAPPPPVDSVVFAEEYATELCRCTTVACAEEIRVRYSLDLGRATPTQDSHAMHEAFRRASECREKIPAPAGG